jgi:hypothetical protein
MKKRLKKIVRRSSFRNVTTAFIDQTVEVQAVKGFGSRRTKATAMPTKVQTNIIV